MSDKSANVIAVIIIICFTLILTGFLCGLSNGLDWEEREGYYGTIKGGRQQCLSIKEHRAVSIFGYLIIPISEPFKLGHGFGCYLVKPRFLNNNPKS